MSDRCKKCGACKECGAPQPQIVPMPYPVYPYVGTPFVSPNTYPYQSPRRPFITGASLGPSWISPNMSGTFTINTTATAA